MSTPNGATVPNGQQCPFNISIDDSRRLRVAVEQLSVGDMDQAMFDHIVGELAKQHDQEKIQEAIDRFRAKSGKTLAQKFIESAITAKQLKALPAPIKPPTIGEWLEAGDIGYVFAQRGVGKTWFSMEMSNAISSGKNFGLWEVKEAQKVLYVDGEVSLTDSQARNAALGIDNDNLIYLHHEHLYSLTNETMDIANAEQQEAFLELCLQLEVKTVILDNLSCLAPYLDENEGFKFSNELLTFILNMRRNGISLVFIEHAGRNGLMRGHSRREDAANWIIRLDEAKDAGEVIGAKFLSVFVKNRNAAKTPTTYEWHFKPDGGRTIPTIKEMDPLSMFRSLIEAGITANKEIAEAMGLKPYEVTRLARKAEKQGWLKASGKGGYSLTKDAENEAPQKKTGDTACTVAPDRAGIRVTCSISGEEIVGARETKAKPGATLYWALCKLDDQCACGDSHYVED
jgi:hypothetical protein